MGAAGRTSTATTRTRTAGGRLSVPVCVLALLMANATALLVGAAPTAPLGRSSTVTSAQALGHAVVMVKPVVMLITVGSLRVAQQAQSVTPPNRVPVPAVSGSRAVRRIASARIVALMVAVARVVLVLRRSRVVVAGFLACAARDACPRRRVPIILVSVALVSAMVVRTL